MRILVLGATGFIGRHITAALLGAGHHVVAAVRRPAEAQRRFPGIDTVQCDLARDVTAAVWLPRLQGIDAVVNVAGLLRGPAITAVHVEGPRALYAACRSAGLRRIIHISAISADTAAGTDYARSKWQAEEELRAQGDLDWVILRPSLVYHQGSYGGTSLLRGLAGLPGLLPLPGDGAQLFQPIHADDLARAVCQLVADSRVTRATLEPAGPETLRLRDILLRLRAWLGLPPARLIPQVPMPLIHALAWLGEMFGRGPVSRNAVAQMIHGNTGDAAGFARAIGWQPMTMAEAQARHPAHVQDRWHARLYWLRPAARLALALLWLASGIIGLFAGIETVQPVLDLLQLPPAAARPLAIAFCGLDLLLGAALLLRWFGTGLLTAVQLAVVTGYSLVLTLAAPALWADPYGPLLKNLPILVLIAIHWALDDDT